MYVTLINQTPVKSYDIHNFEFLKIESLFLKMLTKEIV